MGVACRSGPAVDPTGLVFGMLRAFGFAAILATVIVFASQGSSVAQDRECGASPDDWCAAPPGDPCGRHRNANDCRNDFSCNAVPFRGVTKIACITDRRGFRSIVRRWGAGQPEVRPNSQIFMKFWLVATKGCES